MFQHFGQGQGGPGLKTGWSPWELNFKCDPATVPLDIFTDYYAMLKQNLGGQWASHGEQLNPEEKWPSSHGTTWKSVQNGILLRTMGCFLHLLKEIKKNPIHRLSEGKAVGTSRKPGLQSPVSLVVAFNFIACRL